MEIKSLGPEDLDGAVALLAAAFVDRPFYRYLAPDPVERREFLALNFRLRLEHSFEAGHIDGAMQDRQIAGLAVWVPPAAPPPPEDRSMETAFAGFSPGLRERFFGFLRILTAARDEVVRQPHWSLAPIAVLPEKQGSGIASALIRKKLAEIDALAQPCFLGTQDEQNLAIYGRYGFQKVREDPLTAGLTHYTMLQGGAPSPLISE
jgi:GNAT superfamily N-acetyltransferase